MYFLENGEHVRSEVSLLLNICHIIKTGINKVELAEEVAELALKPDVIG